MLESSKSGKMKKKKKNNNYSIKCDNGPRLKAVGVVNYSFSHSGTEFFMSSLSILWCGISLSNNRMGSVFSIYISFDVNICLKIVFYANEWEYNLTAVTV